MGRAISAVARQGISPATSCAQRIRSAYRGHVDNPAQALIELLDDWKGPINQPPETHRQAGTPGGLDLWQLQNKAVLLLVDIEQVLDEIEALDPDEDLSANRQELVGVYQAVYGYEPTWKVVANNSGTKPVLRDPMPLRRLSSLIRSHRRATSRSNGSDRAALLETLGEALEELEDATYLGAEIRAYLITLVRRAIDLAKDAASTDGQVRAASSEVGGMLVATAGAAAPKEKVGVLFRLGANVLEKVLVSLGVDGANKALSTGGDLVGRLIDQ